MQDPGLNDLLDEYDVLTEWNARLWKRSEIHQYIEARLVRAFLLSERPLPLRQPHITANAPAGSAARGTPVPAPD